MRGHEAPFDVQFSLFLANRVGQLKEVLDLFTQEGLHILGLSVVDSTDWAVIRLVFRNPDKARTVLQRFDLPFTESDVLLVEMLDENSLPELCGHLVRAEINVHFAYPLTIRSHESPVMVFHVEDHVLACQLLARHGFTLLGKEDLREPY